jgi:uncharacterized protein YcfJ
MRLFNFVAWTGIAILVAIAARPAHAEAVMQKVCHEDVKTKREVCKTIKTHKKVEGTPVPEAPAKKTKKK